MKKEQVRLQQLRDMPYKDYLLTPEWQKTQKLVLQRAQGHCQECDAQGVELEVYHTNGENLGCEQERDVIVLCQRCYDRISREDGNAEVPHFTLQQRAKVFAPAALVG